MSTNASLTEFEWTRLLGTSDRDEGRALTTGSDGSIYIAGDSQGALDGQTSYGDTWTTNDVIGVAFDIDAGSLTFYKNGVSQGEAFTGLSSALYYPEVQIYKAYGNINFGQQPWIHTPPNGYVGLYQEWKDYVRSSLGYALDRINRLEELRLEDAATINVLRTDITSALSRIASIESDEINDDAVDNALLTLVGNLSSQVTAWQSRIETAETALAAALDRITTLEGN